MSFKNLSILLFVAVGCIHNAQAYPAYPAAPDSTPPTTGAILADTATSTTPPKTPSATGADASGKGAAGTGSILADKPGPADLKAAPAATKAPGTDGKSKAAAAGLTQADLVEACAPLLKDGKLVAGADAPKKQPTPAIPPPVTSGEKQPAPAIPPPVTGGGGKEGGKEGGKTSPGKDPKLGAASTLSGASMSSAALPIILSITVGWLFG
ncbi:hypothetical protein MJO28_010918 [Puccinia striiformis f. sp. tritici]|uniref:Uncharacterized protein n=1 Tax=Puccinia striiformis f. sp. tritici TaxID=168172 RepID=A0ACC0E5Z6_9BASI|nr:hypothetical protein Pst134EB_020647 [Puccinia striiformis f. sp. tritici]KAI7945223.1 hypothetical protein MJO28_010918 [Puccinia striiformis f. sp. tritici]KAI9610390.1 hypothetical protein H4Q26_006529 [Puccinia striiformis f. sp. tritici PST-130]